MSRTWQRILITGGVVTGVAIVALLAVIAYVLLSGNGGGSGTQVARITPTAAVSAAATRTPRGTPAPTAPAPTLRPELGQASPVVTTVRGETPLPGVEQPLPSSSPSPSTSTPSAACPGPPTIASFTANPSTITAGDSSTLNWGPVTNTAHAVIDQGIGEVAGWDSMVVTPPTTTSYTLTASGCGGTTTKQVTVIVNPAPQPTPTEQAPPPGGGSWGILTADLAVTDLYPDNLPQGEVYV